MNFQWISNVNSFKPVHCIIFSLSVCLSLFTTFRTSQMPKSQTINISHHNNTYHFFYNRNMVGSHMATKLITNISQTWFKWLINLGQSILWERKGGKVEWLDPIIFALNLIGRYLNLWRMNNSGLKKHWK